MNASSPGRFHSLLRDLACEYTQLFEKAQYCQSLGPTSPPPPLILSPAFFGDSPEDVAPLASFALPEVVETTPLSQGPSIAIQDHIEIIPGTLPHSNDIESSTSSNFIRQTACSSVTLSSASKTFSAFEDPTRVKEDVRRMSDAMQELSEAPARSISRLFSQNIRPASFREEGFFSLVAKSKAFEVVTLVMIVLNGIWIAIDADCNPADFLFDADPIFIIVENMFCFIFTIEVLIRFSAFNRKAAALRDAWFLFDTSLVVLTIAETWIIPVIIAIAHKGQSIPINASILRLLRLVRLSRLSRIVRFVPELSFMVKGVFEATRSVACTMGLLFGILFVFGIVLRRLSNDTEMGDTYFSSVPHAIFTLFAQGTLLDGVAELMLEVNREDTICAIIVLFVVMVGALTLMNMLVGVLCEVMNTVAHNEQERMAMNFVSDQIRVALLEIDTNFDKMISKEEFQHILLNPKAAQALRDVGVDVVAFVDFADYFFQSDKHGELFDEKLSFDAFMEIVRQFRGVNSATVRDIIELRKLIHRGATSRNAMLKRLQENQKTLAANQQTLERCIMRSKSKSKSNDSTSVFP